MSGMELNKIMGAVLVAGIVASLSGFIAKETVHAHKLHENAVKIEGGHDTAAVASIQKPKMPAPILAMIAGADVAKGEKLSRACSACHSFDQGGSDGLGPNLWNVLNRHKGGKTGYNYSKAMQEKGGKWDYASLNKFLWKPKAYVDGTKMGFMGLKKPEDRAAMIAWLRTLSDNAASLPSVADIAAEAEELTADQ